MHVRHQPNQHLFQLLELRCFSGKAKKISASCKVLKDKYSIQITCTLLGG